MAKVKIPRKSISLDMTAMCDMAFLLLTFFMLTTQFKPDEPVVVDTPSSISETLLQDVDVMVISIDKEGKVFFGVDGQFTREKIIESMSAKYNLPLTEKEKKDFSLLSSIGVPMSALKQYLNTSKGKRNKMQTGIPVDSVDNQLRDWVAYARYANKNPFKYAIKGDREANYAVVKKVIATLQEQKINRINMVTNLEAKPKN